MRSCIYCGRELEKGEICNCPQSIAHRKARETQSDTSNNAQQQKEQQKKQQEYKQESTQYQQSSYHTGYTKKDSKIKHAWDKYKMKRSAHMSDVDAKGFFKNLFAFIKQFIISPIETVINPLYLNRATVLVICALQGALTWLCMYFVMNNVRRGPFTMLASFFSVRGYANIAHILLSLFSGAMTGIILFFIYCGIFYGINRLIFKIDSKFWDLAQRLVIAGIPMTVIGAIGALCSFFSSTTLMILLLCGAGAWIVLTYEALKTEWISKSPGKIMYAMMLGLFVFFAIVCYLVRLA